MFSIFYYLLNGDQDRGWRSFQISQLIWSVASLTHSSILSLINWFFSPANFVILTDRTLMLNNHQSFPFAILLGYRPSGRPGWVVPWLPSLDNLFLPTFYFRHFISDIFPWCRRYKQWRSPVLDRCHCRTLCSHVFGPPSGIICLKIAITLPLKFDRSIRDACPPGRLDALGIELSRLVLFRVLPLIPLVRIQTVGVPFRLNFLHGFPPFRFVAFPTSHGIIVIVGSGSVKYHGISKCNCSGNRISF
jgi:hypothetical protein